MKRNSIEYPEIGTGDHGEIKPRSMSLLRAALREWESRPGNIEEANMIRRSRGQYFQRRTTTDR
jgi:hypothetical protein